MSKGLKYYLAAYNFIAGTFWLLYFGSFIVKGCKLDNSNVWLLNVAQGLAVLEILHALLRWVKSPVGSTIAQVGSRLLVLALINLPILYFQYWKTTPEYILYLHLFNAGMVTVSFAWSITEIIRYSFYFLGLFDVKSRWLLWMRYSFFIVLYPIGVTGEWLIFIPNLMATIIHKIVLAILFIAYAYYFPILYKYMWKQRKAKL